MKGIKFYIITGILFVSVLGTFLHFAYDLSGNQFLVGLFSPVNESIWEHTKLIFFPTLLYGLFLNQKLKGEYPDIYGAAVLGALTGVLFIIIAFYAYSGILGYHLAPVDISIFYISVMIAFYCTYKAAQSSQISKWSRILTIISILMIGVYLLFTVVPPKIPLFAKP